MSGLWLVALVLLARRRLARRRLALLSPDDVLDSAGDFPAS